MRCDTGNALFLLALIYINETLFPTPRRGRLAKLDEARQRTPANGTWTQGNETGREISRAPKACPRCHFDQPSPAPLADGGDRRPAPRHRITIRARARAWFQYRTLRPLACQT